MYINNKHTTPDNTDNPTTDMVPRSPPLGIKGTGVAAVGVDAVVGSGSPVGYGMGVRGMLIRKNLDPLAIDQVK